YDTFLLFFLFFFNATATTYIYTLSLHDALPIYHMGRIDAEQGLDQANFRHLLALLKEDKKFWVKVSGAERASREGEPYSDAVPLDRKSTRLNSSHSQISYAVFCLKKKKKRNII